MPKHPPTDPICRNSITDQEIAFASLILSGTMDDRRAAEAVGLNPSTAEYTKSKPCVRDYMIEHRAAVSEKLVNQEAEGLPNSNVSRDLIRNQILDRLWQLANLAPEATRGSIAGQIKAMSMIVTIEGLIPNRRTPAQAQPVEPPPKAQIYIGKPYRKHQDPENDATIDEGESAAPHEPEPEIPGTPQPPHPALESNHPNAAIHQPLSRTPTAAGYGYEAIVSPAGPLSLSMSARKGLFNRGQNNR